MIRYKRLNESQHKAYRLKETINVPFSVELFTKMFDRTLRQSKGYHEAEKYMYSDRLKQHMYYITRRIEKAFVALEELDITVESASPWIEWDFDIADDYDEFASHYTATVIINAPTKINKPQLFKTIGDIWSHNFGYPPGEVSYQQIEFEAALHNKMWTNIKIDLDNRNRLHFNVNLWRDERE